MYKSVSVEAESDELILKNKHGDHVIIPSNKRKWVQKKLDEGCHKCIDALVETLPVSSQYAEEGGLYEKDKPPVESKSSEYEKIIKKKGKLNYEQAISYIKEKGLKGKDLHQFLLNNVKNGWKLPRTEMWEQLVKDPNYKVPITEDEILAYRKYSETSSRLQADPTFNELKEYLTKGGYQPNTKYGAGKVTGQRIIDDAKRQGVKVEELPDGTYQMMDDVNTYTDTDQSFGKARIIHPLATYDKTPYTRGKDIVNHYNMAVPPTYPNRVPTSQEMIDYSQGQTYVAGLTPEYKKVYIDKYFEPNAPKNTYYGTKEGASGGDEEINRYNEAMNVANEISRYKKSGEAFKDQTKRLKAEERKETWKGIGKGALMGAAGVAGVAALPVIAPLIVGGAVVNRVLSGGANNPTLGRDNKSKSGNF
jgi:hypothetical protein